MKNIVVVLFCAVFAFSSLAYGSTKDTIHIELDPSSTANRIAVSVKNAKVDTIAVQMKDSLEGVHWEAMHYDEVDDQWVVEVDDEFVFPLSFSLTSESNQHITVSDVISSLEDGLVDTGIQYSTPDSDSAAVPRRHKPTTRAPTRRPTTRAPTTRPSTPTTRAPVTSRPSAPTTRAPVTSRPSTPTTAPSAPTTAPSAPSSGGMKIMVPLYTYPGATWTTVATGAKYAKTVAIINPSSGPGNGPDSTYKTYMNTLKSAGVEMIGYVHTSYGARSLTDVKADINKYASEYPLVVGIFIDEAAADAAQVSYYTQVHNYIMSMPGYKYNVLNPGTVPVQAYYAISTQIVSFEVDASKFASSKDPTYANAANKDHFSVITYGASEALMKSVLQSAKSKGYYGWVSVTDRGLTGGTYNALPSYYLTMAQEVQRLNNMK